MDQLLYSFRFEWLHMFLILIVVLLGVVTGEIRNRVLTGQWR